MPDLTDDIQLASEQYKELLASRNQGIKLDIACGRSRQPGWVGIDYQALPGVDIVHNIEICPWPLPDESVSVSIASHIMEHIDPHGGDSRLQPLANLLIEKGLVTQGEIDARLGVGGPVFLRMMDEIWRITKVGGQLGMVMPYGGSPGDLWDPTHCNHVTETTWAYFDPEDRSHNFNMWQFYQPKPWKIEQCFWRTDGNLEVLLKKRPDIYSMNGHELVKVEENV